MLAEFARADRLWRITPGGERPTTLVETLGLGPDVPGVAGERLFQRHVGDFALFMSGLFRPFVERGGFLGLYLGEGSRAYARVATLSEGRARGERLLFGELAAHFEHYAGALDYLRKVRFPGLAGRDPIGAFLDEIEGVVAGLSRN